MRVKYNPTFKPILAAIALFFCFSCNTDNFNSATIDKDGTMTRDDLKYSIVKDTRKIKEETQEKERALLKEKNIPNISKLVASPPPPPIGNGRLISFSVTEEVPLKDVLIELGRIADIDIEVDPAITGGIILRITKQPLDLVIQRICILGKLRYSYVNNILRFERDTPYNMNYTVDFLINDDLWSSIQTSIQNILTNSEDANAKININKQANLINIYANERMQEKVQAYIREAKRNYSAQVLIEAKIVEVSLTDSFQAGIDWNISDNKGHRSVAVSALPTFASSESAVFSGIIDNSSLSATIQALEKFGAVKTLSSPRIHAINNQQAELEFITTLVYFSVERDVTSATEHSGEKTQYTTTKLEDYEGITLKIIPSINLDSQEITMNVIPELRSKTGTVSDPNPNITNEVPLIQTRKMKTSLKLKSGGIMVIGGLMNNSSVDEDRGVPFLSKTPVLGWLFKSTKRHMVVTETVIFLKASIVDSSGSIDRYDRDFHNKFSTEKRPFF
jgi:hypothetical protein